MSKTTRITEKGQATIPKRLRDKYNLEPGDQVVWLEGEDGIVVRKRTQSGGRGLLAPDADADERAAIAKRLSEGTREARDREYDLYE